MLHFNRLIPFRKKQSLPQLVLLLSILASCSVSFGQTPCLQNAVTNGDFSNVLNGWSNSGGWMHASGTAHNPTNGTVIQSLSQSLSNIYVNSDGNIIIKMRFLTTNCQGGGCVASQAHANFLVAFAGVEYASLTNPPGTGVAVVGVAALNGATVTTQPATFNTGEWADVTITIPWSGPSPASGTIALIHAPEGGTDDNSVTNVFVPTLMPAPVINTATVQNACPETTVNLNNYAPAVTPGGSEIVWFDNPDQQGVPYGTANAATAGTYYLYYHNSSTGCYTGASSPVTVQITQCNLPVTLISYTVSKQESAIRMKWVTSQETNSDRFEIQRSGNGKKWINIGSTAAQRNSQKLVTYTFEDPSPLQGQNLYRLKMIDQDQTFSYSTIRDVNFDSPFLTPVFPNPVGSKFTISIDGWKKVKTVTIHNLAGIQVHNAPPPADGIFGVETLPPGVYILSIIYLDNRVQTNKFVRSDK